MHLGLRTRFQLVKVFPKTSIAQQSSVASSKDETLTQPKSGKKIVINIPKRIEREPTDILKVKSITATFKLLIQVHELNYNV